MSFVYCDVPAGWFRLIYLVVFFAIAISSSLAKEPRQIFGEIYIGKKDGLRLTTEIYRQEYKADDEMVIRVKFENATEKTLYISEHQHANVGSFVLYGFVPRNQMGSVPRRGVNPNFKYKRPPLPKLSLNDFVLITPGGNYIRDITIRLYDYTFLPGEYHFIVYHNSLWYQKDVQELEGLWGHEHGTLYSEITVNDTPLPEQPMIVITSDK
jgi:hypothetical protein